MAKGRPRKIGARRRDGRLVSAPRDQGNAFVQARRAAFAMFQGGKAGDQLGDAIGRAWAVGLLDGRRHDGATLRDLGRRYASLNAIVFAKTQMAVADPEPYAPGTGEGSSEDPIGERYDRLDRCARAAGSKERLAMRKLCVECSPDEDPLWLARLIACRRGGLAPQPRDARILRQAADALSAMAEG